MSASGNSVPFHAEMAIETPYPGSAYDAGRLVEKLGRTQPQKVVSSAWWDNRISRGHPPQSCGQSAELIPAPACPSLAIFPMTGRIMQRHRSRSASPWPRDGWSALRFGKQCMVQGAAATAHLKIRDHYFCSLSPLRRRLAIKLASIDGAGTRPSRDGLE